MRPAPIALVALSALFSACERPNLGDDSGDTGDTADDTGDTSDDTGDTGDTDTSVIDTADSDTDTDTGTIDTADTDTGTDTGFGWDPLYLYPPGNSCDGTIANQRGIPPKANGTWGAGRFSADSVNDMTVYQVRFVMRHGTTVQGQACDASGTFEMRLIVTDTAASPDGSTSPTVARTHTFDAVTLGAVTKRDLVYTLETPLVVPHTDNLWVAVNGTIPGTGDPSCWQMCRQGAAVDMTNQNFFTNEATQGSWVWHNFADYGITDDEKMEYMITVWYLE